MEGQAEVHVGDIGTTYRDEIQDNGVPFDFSDATARKFIFKVPTYGILIRDAELYTEGVGVDQKWYLQYIVNEADVAAGLHLKSGKYQRQGYLEIPTGQRYHTTIVDYQVDKNLASTSLHDIEASVSEGIAIGGNI